MDNNEVLLRNEVIRGERIAWIFRRQRSNLWLRFVSVTMDITGLTLYNHFEALTSATLLLYPTIILVAALRLEHSLRVAARQRRSCGILYLDLDGFKPVNDGLGHEVGDKVLVEIAARLVQLTRDSDLVARVGGDEFVLVVPLLDSMAVLAMYEAKHAGKNCWRVSLP